MTDSTIYQMTNEAYEKGADDTRNAIIEFLKSFQDDLTVSAESAFMLRKIAERIEKKKYFR